MAKPAGPHLFDRSTEKTLGVALISIGSWLLYQAYEGRGASRPFATKLLPGG